MLNCCGICGDFSLLHGKKTQPNPLFSLFPAFLRPHHAKGRTAHRGKWKLWHKNWELEPLFALKFAERRMNIQDTQGNQKNFPLCGFSQRGKSLLQHEEFWGRKICFCWLVLQKKPCFVYLIWGFFCQGILQMKGLNQPWHFPAGERSFAATNKKDSTRANKEEWIPLMA